MAKGATCTRKKNGSGRMDVFAETQRGRAAIEAAGLAVAAVVQGQGLVRVGVRIGGAICFTSCMVEDHVSFEARVQYFLAGPMAWYACGLDEYYACDPFYVRPFVCPEAIETIRNWHACELRDPAGAMGDEQFNMEMRCLFELYKVRTLRFLKQPNRVDAILALARELLTREEVPADEATALIQRHLVSA